MHASFDRDGGRSWSPAKDEEHTNRRTSISLIPRRYSVTTPYALQPSFPAMTSNTSNITSTTIGSTHQYHDGHRHSIIEFPEERETTVSSPLLLSPRDSFAYPIHPKDFEAMGLHIVVVGTEKLTCLAVIPQLRQIGFKGMRAFG
eukprot:TRINITY_DN3863_c0_g1_i1.p1 TRINITY_DN3863_c0_g1~~TRINITY_DN3863_c0_g1_i1.p1  ORF type:complete len:145 (+),score=22.65 TRINITY_DN3863_c0_g1_i1:105-539(+)